MKTVELVKDLQSNEDPIQRVSNIRADVLTRMNVAKYVPKSRWKIDVRDKRMEELKRVEKEKFAAIGKEVKGKKPHFKKGQPHGNSSKREKGSHNQGQQRVQGEDRKTG